MAEKTSAIRLSGTKARILGEGAWIAFGQIASALALLAGTRVLTELINPDIFGTVSLLTGISVLANAIFCGPFLQAALRFYPDAAKKGQVANLKKIIDGFLLKTIGPLVCVLLIAGIIFRNKVSILEVLALAGLLVIDVIRTKETNFLNAERMQRPYAIWLASDAWARLIAVLAVIYALGASAGHVLAGYFAGSLVVLIFFSRFVKRGIVDKSKPEDVAMAAGIRRYAMPLMPLAIVGWISSLSDRYIIGGMAGLGQVGIYAAVYGLLSRPFLMAEGIIEQTIRPVYYDAVSSGNRLREKRVFFYWLAVTVLVCICCIALLTTFRGVISNLILAKKYRIGADLMPWIALGYAFLVISHVFEKICYAYKNTKYILFTQIIGTVACLCVEIPAIYHYGMFGAAAAVPVYFGIQLVVTIFLANRITRAQESAGV